MSKHRTYMVELTGQELAYLIRTLVRDTTSAGLRVSLKLLRTRELHRLDANKERTQRHREAASE